MKEPKRPMREEAQDFRCNEICPFSNENGCNDCEEDDCNFECGEAAGLADLKEITLGGLVEKYGDLDLNNIKIKGDDYCIKIFCPEPEEKYLPRVIKWEKEMEKYRKWLIDNPPEKQSEKKKLAKEKRKQKKIAQLEKSLEKLRSEK